MATGMYDTALQMFLDGELSWTTGTFKAMVVDHAEYTPNLASDSTVEDIPVDARVGISSEVMAKTSAAGVADGGDVTFTALTGPVCEGVVVFLDSGLDSSSVLVCHIDEGDDFPIVPDGEDYILSWSNGPNKIFRL